MRRIWRLAAALALLLALCGCALADGNGSWVYSRMHGYVELASHAGGLEGYGWVALTGLGGDAVSDTHQVRVISKSASIWAQPRTNSQKLGTVSNGDTLDCVQVSAANGGGVVLQDGFYAVEYKGNTGWINSAYAVRGPFEIILMESNVPAYCAPDSASNKVGSLTKLTRYTVIGFYNDYYVINLRGGSAFIPMSVAHYDTAFERLHGTDAVRTLTVTTGTALRVGPGEQYAKLSDVRAGQTFACVDEIDGWCLVIDGSSDGYAYVWSGDAQVEW